MAPEMKAKPKMRSPEHPAVGLEEAINRAAELYRHESFNPTPVDVAKQHWGYGAKSSSGMRLLAALTHYGLLDGDDAAGSARRVKLSALAKSILMDKRPDSSDLREAIRRAALNPKLYAALWAAWKPDLPSDANMEFDLIQNYGFNPESVRGFISDFKATVKFAKLAESGKLEDEGIVGPEAAGAVQPVMPEVVPLPKSNPLRQEPPMTAIPLDPNVAPPLDITVPLFRARRAVLRVPVHLTNVEFDLIRKAVVDQLDMYRDVLVGGSSPTPPQE